MDVIQINLILEGDFSQEVSDILLQGDQALNQWARDELLRLLEGDDPEIDWGARFLGVTIKKG